MEVEDCGVWSAGSDGSCAVVSAIFRAVRCRLYMHCSFAMILEMFNKAVNISVYYDERTVSVSRRGALWLPRFSTWQSSLFILSRRDER
jgi:hypothetical protein